MIYYYYVTLMGTYMKKGQMSPPDDFSVDSVAHEGLHYNSNVSINCTTNKGTVIHNLISINDFRSLVQVVVSSDTGRWFNSCPGPIFVAMITSVGLVYVSLFVF